jgi:hypothetical protein
MNKIKWLIFLAMMLFVLKPAFSDSQELTWQTPYGTFGLPFSATEALIGYDGIIKEAIAGFSLPVYADPKGIVSLQVGAIAPWQTNQATIQPYVAAGHDIMREIPYLSKFQSAHLNVFGRWDSGSGKAGAGISFSYGFAGGSSPATTAQNLAAQPQEPETVPAL